VRKATLFQGGFFAFTLCHLTPEPPPPDPLKTRGSQTLQNLTPCPTLLGRGGQVPASGKPVEKYFPRYRLPIPKILLYLCATNPVLPANGGQFSSFIKKWRETRLRDPLATFAPRKVPIPTHRRFGRAGTDDSSAMENSSNSAFLLPTASVALCAAGSGFFVSAAGDRNVASYSLQRMRMCCCCPCCC